jgi:leucyl-tRNA synthetase
MKSTMQRTIKKTIDAFDNFDLRVATNEIFFECQKNIQWYFKRGGSNKKLIDKLTSVWFKLMAPVTPHLAEELWSKKNKNLITNESFPIFNLKEIAETEEVGEYLISEVTDDIAEILKVTKIKPKKICIYTSPNWKQELFKKAIKQSEENKINIGDLITETLKDAKMKLISKEVSQYVGKLPNEIMKLNDNDKKRYLIPIKESNYLENAKEYLKKVFSCEIEIYDATNENIYDPGHKARYAIPLRPAIYIE